MPVVCPTVTGAETEAQYKMQMERIAPIAHRIQIDLADGEFSSPKTIEPSEAWWPAAVKADFHIMYQKPAAAAQTVLEHKPHLVIVHGEAEGDLALLAKACHDRDVKIGIALLPETPPHKIEPIIGHIDHVLIFSGHLGHFGGRADLSLLEKVKLLKQRKADLEIGWDGGIDDQNVSQLVFGGVDVLNVGGYIHDASDPAKALRALQIIADETGTT